MKLQDKIDVSILNSVYGELLTPHQKEMVRLYYDCDISLFEISEQFNVSRQAVRDALVRAEKSLYSYEEKLGLVKRNNLITKKIEEISSKTDDQNVKAELNTLLSMMEE